ncbi:MAG TPA: helix-turn-helix domain-containing protein [Spirochaetota bacterium]|nr:helix-turn-helix domain-containing protein [Spirochaetota bacterium]HRX48712.1 helix-turn-helix domain-containing protein [Spirochaetota bacterium]
MLTDIIKFFTLFGGCLSLALASAHLVERKRTDAHFLIFGFLCSLGIWQIYHGFMISGFLFRHPHLALVHVPFLYLSAPFLYFYYQILTRDNFRFRRSSLCHFIPVIAILLVLAPFYIKTGAEKLELLQSFVGLRRQSRVFPSYPYIVLSIVTIICGYAFAVGKDAIRMYKKKMFVERNPTLYSIIIVAFNFSMIIIYVTGFLIEKLFLQTGSYYLSIIKTISAIMTCEIYIILLLKWRYPGYIRHIKEEAQKIRYSTSRIDRIDVESVLEKLTYLMENEKIFCDEEITLGKLADELDITPYQLSQILNERLNKNFNTFINEYRIRESENYLLEDRKRSVLSVSYAVGFNTVTSFYNAFYKSHGMTPAQFREKCRKHA